jgi:Protein of unknown function (DUF3307)
MIAMAIASRLFLLIAGHALADYPLQGDFLARGKNFRNPIPGVPWYQCMLAHCMIHAGVVYLITHSLVIGLAEFGLHFMIDYAKCDGRLTFNQDQGLHIVCKGIWAVVA